MGYMIEGGGSKTMAKTKEWLEKYSKDVHKLLSILTRVIVDYLVMQVNSTQHISLHTTFNGNYWMIEANICDSIHF